MAWVRHLSQQGSPLPARDERSPTGYSLGQRHFLGTHERGETYRWIAAAQEVIASGAWRSPWYEADTVPTGRPPLIARAYALWLAGLAWIGHLLTGAPAATCAENAALWDPVILHGIAYLAIVGLLWRRFGTPAAALTGACLAVLPALTAQFLPGVLSPRPWAMVLAAVPLGLQLARTPGDKRSSAFGAAAAGAAGLALWLDPALGFPAILLSALLGACAIAVRDDAQPFWQWSLLGGGIAVAGWWLDRTPWDLSASELRSVHPLYALAWIGLGLGLDAAQKLRQPGARRRIRIMQALGALLLFGGLIYPQCAHGYKGWLYPSAAMERLTSLDETVIFGGLFDWLAHASAGERVFLAVPIFALAAVVAVGARAPRSHRTYTVLTASVLLIGLLALSLGRVRWLVMVAWIAPVIAGALIRPWSNRARRQCGIAVMVYLLALAGWNQSLPCSLARPAGADEPKSDDLNALIYRHFAQWLATHNPGQKINALAPPELSDSLVFHSGCHVLTSTAWASYPGQVAASRILSAPEATEAEAVLQSREITHVIIPSWDHVLPLLVRTPPEQDRTSLYARLQRWIYPPYLRPLPYHLPAVPGYADQKLVVFKVVPPQDEALSLARLAEYFVEMDRAEPAALAAQVLAQSFPDDPNAVIARALVCAHANDRAGFEQALARVVADSARPDAALSWDRRVQRAIVFALGKRAALERTEIAACVTQASADTLFDLTPLEAYRLCALARANGVAFRDPEVGRLAEALGAEYRPGAAAQAAP
jgi:hypothetical protein